MSGWPSSPTTHPNSGHSIGGVFGDLLWDWLHIDSLWTHEDYRGRGVGSALMRHIEEAARERGIVNIHLATTSFQALPFYLKLGYEVFGELPNKPIGSTWYYLRKFGEPLTPQTSWRLKPRLEGVPPQSPPTRTRNQTAREPCASRSHSPAKQVSPRPSLRRQASWPAGPQPRVYPPPTIHPILLNCITRQLALTRSAPACYPAGTAAPRVCVAPRRSTDGNDGGQVQGESSAQRATRTLRASSPLALCDNTPYAWRRTAAHGAVVRHG